MDWRDADVQAWINERERKRGTRTPPSQDKGRIMSRRIMSRVVTLALGALLAVGCVEADMFVPAPDAAGAPVWVNDGGVTLAYRKAQAALNASYDFDVEDGAEILAHLQLDLAAFRLKLEALRGPNGPALAAEERREREDAFAAEYATNSQSPGWLEAFTDYIRNATVPGLTTAAEWHIERVIGSIQHQREAMAREARAAAPSDS